MNVRASTTWCFRAASLALLLHAPPPPPARACSTLPTTAPCSRAAAWIGRMLMSNIWAFPAGIARDGAAGPNSLHWVSKYGSVGVSGYEAGIPDGMNERGLVANILYLAEAQYPKPVAGKPNLDLARSNTRWIISPPRRTSTSSRAFRICWRRRFPMARRLRFIFRSDATGIPRCWSTTTKSSSSMHGKRYP